MGNFKNYKKRVMKELLKIKEHLSNIIFTNKNNIRIINLKRNLVISGNSGNVQIVRYIPFIFAIIIVIILGLTVPNFLTIGNIINVLLQASALGLMAIGISIVLIGGGIDLSIPSLMGLSGVLGAIFMRNGGNPVIAVFLMLGVCILGGSINGLAVGYLKMVPFVVTFATMTAAMGTSLILTKAVSIGNLPHIFIDTILAKLWGIPAPVIFLILITVIATLLVSNSLYGRWLYAIGTNIETSQVCGIPVSRIIFFNYVIAGLFAGLAAIVTTARLQAGAATIGGEVVVLDVIASAVVGGVSIYGGAGSILGAVFGAIIITLINNIMNLMHVSYYMTIVVKGFIIIAVVALSTFRKR